MSWAAPPGVQTAPYSYTPTMNTAYTAVPVRQGFGQTYQAQPQYPYSTSANPPQSTTAMASSSGQQAQPQKFDWPDSVRSYVQRSFQSSNLDPSVTRAEMEAKLKETIRYTQDCGTMYTTDWDNMPLPQTLIKNERQRALMQSMVPPVLTEAVTAAAIPTTNPKKRKSSDLSVPDSTAPWRAAKGLSLEDRISKPAMDGPLSARSKFQKNVEKRQRRGDGGYHTYRSPSPPPPTGPIVGFNESLEKPYLRLTAAPKAADVRPERVLHHTLDLLKKKWRKDGNYNYICDQFKSMRQDLTVQRVRNDFTVSVYEIHARIALEKGDLGEYNQCQTQLRALYKAGLKGNSIEFKAYRILYFIHTANRTALNDAIADLTTAEKEERPIKHALDVRSALALGNYHKFFQLYLDVPNMGAYLMDMFVKRERLAALANMCKAFKPALKLRYITEELAFESDAEAAQFIIDFNGQDLLEEQQDHIAFLSGKAGTLFETARAEAFSRVDLKGQI
ncbi:SAC3/GANP/Nin1/mts3/eIF-3 p25 family-domain-containing protein [Hypoxylon trugodes]|uniref:SAC3/GANP/Nin1/mts3/eIF-3 p25 family-domain-containing protein n=1 Tax=Hypoxylon trugodes TaxID=326681 RepID=UPI0021913827|nr:SAC3/GANP/Nin1/mts3/eIF-3 p25 family-domain-containing protein [Hypoxylon trugodes]KAI1394028.1 SAC3/GANP/Nin1/mts3/eIF-3 p25 family-domain-containing protein [Hypoxylon trugodes]